MQLPPLKLIKIFLGICLAVFLLVAGGRFWFNTSRNSNQFNASKTVPAKLKSVEMTLAVADDPLVMAQGLSGVSKIDDKEGMLFVFPADTIPSFWMKDMLIPIDIIWLDSNLAVVGFVQGVKPDSYPQLFSPPQPIRYVLEVKAGWVERYNLQIGDKLKLKGSL